MWRLKKRGKWIEKKENVEPGCWSFLLRPPSSISLRRQTPTTILTKEWNIEILKMALWGWRHALSNCPENCQIACRILQNFAESYRTLKNLEEPWRTLKNLTELCRKNASCESVIDHYEQVPKYYMQTITIAITLQYLPCFQICSFFRTFDLVWKIWMETQHKKKSGQRLPSFLQEISVYSIKSRKVGHMLRHMVRHKVGQHRHRWLDGESRRIEVPRFGNLVFRGKKLYI